MINPFVIHALEGAGNRFALMDARKESSYLRWEKNQNQTRAQLAQRICQSELAPLDGVLWISEGPRPETFKWDFYNADGSEAEMCGNAARCAGLYLREVLHEETKEKRELLTGAGWIKIQESAPDLWTVEMPEVRVQPQSAQLQVGGQVYEGQVINSGVPHFVLRDSSLRQKPEICQALRRHPFWGEAGSNVTLLDQETPQSAKAWTYERGVENFTAACGTGAVAAAAALSGPSLQGLYVIHMEGGELRVDFSEARPKLTGPAGFLGPARSSQEILP